MKKAFFISCLLFTSLVLKAQDWHFRYIDLPERNIATAVLQSHTGLMWVGSNKGLYRFDGSSWETFPREDTTGKHWVTALFESKDNTLWVGFADGQIFSLKDQKLTPFLPARDLPDVKITGITEDSIGNMWFATYGDGLHVIDGEKLFKIDKSHGLKDEDLYCVALGPEGKIWVGSDRGVAICGFEEERREVTSLGLEAGFPDQIIEAIYPGENNNIWLGTNSKGFFSYDTSTGKIGNSISNLEQVKGLVRQGGRLWIRTKKQGLFSYENKQLNGSVNNPPFILGNGPRDINDFTVDKGGNLWIAANKEGLAVTRGAFYFPYYEEKNIKAVCPRKDGTVWFSTNEGIFSFDPSSGKSSFIVDDPGLNVISFYEDPSERVWAGTFGEGVLMFPRGEKNYIQITETDGLVNGSVLSIHGNDKEIWFATLGGASVCGMEWAGHKPKFQTYSKEEGLGANYIYQVLSSKQSFTAVFATDGKGLIRFSSGKFTPVKDLEGQTIFSVVEGRDGILWCNSQEKGLVRVDGDSVEVIDHLPDLEASPISSIETDNDGKVVLVRKEGITIYDPVTSAFTTFSEESGVGDLDPELNAIHASKAFLWIGTRKGLVRFSRDEILSASKPNLVIKDVSIFFKPLDKRELANLPHSENHLTFNYVGLWYQNPQAVKYRYKLTGVTEDWIYVKDRAITFPDLSPGKYTFEIQATADNWNESQVSSASLSFGIKPPFWEKWWFAIAVVVAGLGIALFVIKTREDRLKTKERLETEKIEFQFETLKSQVNPHFLFNSLNTLVTVIEEDKEEAVDYVEKLSDFYRSMLEYRSHNLIAITEELEMLKDYFFLQKKRFGDNLNLKIEVDEKTTKGNIAPLTLQMLVENAIKHNVISKSKPMTISVKSESEYLKVSNPIQAKRNQEPSTRVGLQNISNRYALLTSKEVLVEATESSFSVSIPILS